MTVLLRVLGVSASAFYQWQKCPVSQRAQHKELLVAQICEPLSRASGAMAVLASIETYRLWVSDAALTRIIHE